MVFFLLSYTFNFMGGENKKRRKMLAWRPRIYSHMFTVEEDCSQPKKLVVCEGGLRLTADWYWTLNIKNYS